MRSNSNGFYWRYNIYTPGIVCDNKQCYMSAVTPTPKDNEFMGKYIYPVIEMVALNIGKAKEGSTTNPIKFVKRSD